MTLKESDICIFNFLSEYRDFLGIRLAWENNGMVDMEDGGCEALERFHTHEVSLWHKTCLIGQWNGWCAWRMEVARLWKDFSRMRSVFDIRLAWEDNGMVDVEDGGCEALERFQPHEVSLRHPLQSRGNLTMIFCQGKRNTFKRYCELKILKKDWQNKLKTPKN